MLRSKGFFWLASRNDLIGSWSQAGGACRIEPSGFWWAAIPEEDWPDDEEERAQIRSSWDEMFGDRMQQFVVIGVKMDRERITADLDRCLLTDREMNQGQEQWAEFPDPLGEWRVEFAERQEHDCQQHAPS